MLLSDPCGQPNSNRRINLALNRGEQRTDCCSRRDDELDPIVIKKTD